jgi:WD40 repeat protein
MSLTITTTPNEKSTTTTTSAKRVLDPILSLPVPSVVNSLCFVSPRTNESLSHCQQTGKEELDSDHNSSCSSCSDDSSVEELKFRSSILFRQQQRQLHQQADTYNCLHGRYLVTSQRTSGEALLWDLQRYNQPALIIQEARGGPGLAVRRTYDPSKILFQTRDDEGIVSLHAIEQASSLSSSSSSSSSSSIVRQYKTYSQTFCEAAPCVNDEHLVALPSAQDNQVAIMDHRAAEPVIKSISIPGHGMLTSLAMIRCRCHHDHSDANGNDGNDGSVFVCCGMENGNIFHYNITRRGTGMMVKSSSYSLGKQPVLTMDMTPSSTVSSFQSLKNDNNDNNMDGDNYSTKSSFLTAAGLAGDAQEVWEMSPLEAGRAVLYKATYLEGGQSCGWKFQQRVRLSTCRIDENSSTSSSTSSGKPGVGICRFRPDDGRILAIGGWDCRVRLFERTNGRPLAILKRTINDGTGGVSALDWAPDSSQSGLLASACGDTKVVYLWQCFANPIHDTL